MLLKNYHLLWLINIFIICHVHAAQLQFSYNGLIHTEAQPIPAFLDDWDKPIKSGNSAFTYNEARLTYTWGKQYFGLVSRYDYTLTFDPDTALYTYLDKNNKSFDDRDYRYQLTAKHALSHGIFAGYRYNWNDHWFVEPTIMLLGAAHFQDGQIDGYINGNTQLGDLQVDYYFSHDILFKSFDVEQRPQGYGGALDLKLGYQQQAWHIDLVIRDLLYYMKFNDSPFAVGNSNTKAAEIDENGNLISHPSLTLQTHLNNNYVNHSFSLPKRYNLSVEHKTWDNISLYGQWLGFERDDFFQFGAKWQLMEDAKLELGYRTHADVFVLGIANRFGGLTIISDGSGINNSNDLGLSFYLSIPL